jgi:hypothetical protein
MPLESGYSRPVISGNIARLVYDGKAVDQAAAIAFQKARESFKKSFPRKNFPAHLVKENPQALIEDYHRFNPQSVREAVKRYEDFTGQRARRAIVLKDSRVDGNIELTAIGKITGFRIAFWPKEFRFRTVDRPLLTVTHDGKQLVPIGGNFKKLMREFLTIYHAKHYEKAYSLPEAIDYPIFKGKTKIFAIGKINAILYETKRMGSKEYYIHRFSTDSRPLLSITIDENRLILLGGAYDFTERGIEDRI